jgi:hypothetical protein
MFRYATHTLLARAIRQGLASRSTRIALLGATSAVGVFSYSRHASKSVHLDSYQNTLPPLEQSEVKDAHVSIDETLRSHSSKLETAPGISAVYLGALPRYDASYRFFTLIASSLALARSTTATTQAKTTP